MPEDCQQLDPQSRRRFWDHNIKHWQSSGLSQAAYCRKHQLKAHRLYYWRQKAPAGPMV